jgi:predicted transcriptional regulator
MTGAGGAEDDLTTTRPAEAGASGARGWTLLTNHGRVLLLIARNPEARLRDLAERAGITERAAQSIVHDLEDAGYVTKQREGRRNTYVIHPDRPFRHPAEAGHDVGELLGLFRPTP